MANPRTYERFNGWLRISRFKGTTFIHCDYLYYTKKQADKLFTEYYKNA